MKESYIEKKAKEFAKSTGWFCCKFKSTINGMPDDFFARADRGVWLAEFKAPDEDLEEQQKLRHEELRRAGVNVIVFDDLAKAKQFLR